MLSNAPLVCKFSGFFFFIIYVSDVHGSVYLLPAYYDTCTKCMILYLIKNNVIMDSANARGSYHFYIHVTVLMPKKNISKHIFSKFFS